MGEQVRNLALGMLAVGVLAGGAYLGWSVMTGGGSASEKPATEESFADDWTKAEAEAESPETAEAPTDEKAEDKKASKAAETASETAEESVETAQRVAETDETPTVPTSVERVDETAEDVVRSKKVGQQRGQQQERKQYKPAVLQIVTNFSRADVTVNGLPYPEYKSTDDEEEDGMVLPAGGPYTVEVTYDGKKKTYTISLRPYEVRVLMVELSGFKGGPPAPKQTKAPQSPPDSAEAAAKNNDDSGETGRVTVYSKPKGTIQVDGSPKKQKTPGTVEVPPGQHDIQVKFDDGNMSESKTVRVRKGSRIKLFFRKKD